MKKTALTLLLLAVVALGHAKPNITSLNFPKTVDLFGLYELSFALDPYSNPYDPEVIHAYAVFVGPQNQTFTVDAFYYEAYDFSKPKNYEIATPRNEKGWRVRFTPDAVGEWTFTLYATDRKGSTALTAYNKKTLSFQCKEVTSTKGFISKANTRYLKRDVVKGGQRCEEAFFPVGPNIAWYSAADFGRYAKPYGIYEYEHYIDRLQGNANYMRMWINRYQFLSIYGPEQTELVKGFPKMYFDGSLNQKDSAELDHIVQYAKDHNVTITPCIFNFRNFFHKPAIVDATLDKPAMPSDWINNPFHTIVGLKTNLDFFTDREAKRITKNLLRYIVARWGYATNILCWELWNEVSNMCDGVGIPLNKQLDIINWHEEMASFIRDVDPYHHLISTSSGTHSNATSLYPKVFSKLDFVMNHDYQSIQKSISREQFSVILLRLAKQAFELYPDKPFFMGEYGFGQSNPARQYADKDPYGIDMHNSLWSSAFSGAMGPASNWFWEFLKANDLFKRYGPVKTFLNSLPILSDSFQPETTGEVKGLSMVFPNNLETYYLINRAQDTLIGWCQDTAFCYQSLRHLTDAAGNNHHFIDNKVNDPKGYVYTLNAAKRPRASSRDNTVSIAVPNQPVGTRYTVRWFDSETGLELPTETTTAEVKGGMFRQNTLSFEFPRSIRDPKTGAINNTFGDAVFLISKADKSSSKDNAPKPTRRIKVMKK